MNKFKHLALAAVAMAFAAPAMAQQLTRLSDDMQIEAKKIEKDAKERLAEVIEMLKSRPIADKDFQLKINALQDAKDALDKAHRNGERVSVGQKSAPDNATETLRNEKAKIPFALLERARDALMLVQDLKGLHKDTKERLAESAAALNGYIERVIKVRDGIGKHDSKTFAADVKEALKALESLQKTQVEATGQEAIFAKVNALREEYAKETGILRKGEILIALTTLANLSDERRAADRLVADLEKEQKIVTSAKAAEEKFKAVKALE